MANERVYSGKKVLFVSLAAVVLFAIGMGYGTYFFAQWLTPILQKKSQEAPKGASAPSPSSSNSPG